MSRRTTLAAPAARVIASERTSTTRTLAEEAAFFAGGPVAKSPARRVLGFARRDPKSYASVWLLATLRDVMDRRIALERIAATPTAPAEPGHRIIAEERVTTTRTLTEDAAIFAGAPLRHSSPRRQPANNAAADADRDGAED